MNTNEPIEIETENTVNPNTSDSIITEAQNKVDEQQPETPQEQTLEAKVAELNDKYLRLYSEFDNYRKRTIKEKSDIIKSGGEDVFKIIIPILDDFERAIKANETITDATPVKDGMQLIYNKLKLSCTQKGLQAMENIGNPFDADTMEALAHIPAPTEDLKNKVVDEMEKGYKLGDKVIRFAKVVVGN